MGELYRRLKEYSESDYYPFHMPGHKRRQMAECNPYSCDITEIEGFDNLHEPEGILRIAMEKVSKMYGTGKTYFMVNGSSGGILSAISAVTRRGGRIAVARNCHKSVYNAIYLNGLTPVYIYPGYIEEFGINGGITPESVRKVLNEYPDTEAVVITSPTYEGIVSDVRKIAEIVHSCGIPLVVDEAHGAHFGMNENLPESAVTCGADIVIQSTHKTLPALTQTALLHVNGNIADTCEVEKYLKIFQTSSPSYVLMSSIDECFDTLQKSGGKMFETYIKRMQAMKKCFKKFTHLRILDETIRGNNGVFDTDISKVVISSGKTGYTGMDIYRELIDTYHLQPEMASANYVIAMTSVMDTEEGLQRLFKALSAIDRDARVYGAKKDSLRYGGYDCKMPQAVVIEKISDVDNCAVEKVGLDESRGKISTEYIYLYPPGIPLIVPGEMITGEVLALIKKYKSSGLELHGLKHSGSREIEVVKEKFRAII